MKKAIVLQHLIEESGYSVNKVAKLAGIPQSTLATMLKNGVGKAGVDGVSNVCKVLGITLDDLIYLSEGEHSPHLDRISPKEQTHLKKYRQLTEQGRQAIDSTIDAMLAALPSNVIPMASSDDAQAAPLDKDQSMVPMKISAYGGNGTKKRMISKESSERAAEIAKQIREQQEEKQRQREEADERIRGYFSKK